ncbi:hypothetical protein A3K63_05170 [Candidatus Micrarchaeota archaeon RBG_16_49_10]|nr:MAG: hypothetical protein A3K63_05170 [Candidatus Micrarchaeota archaeon RBG_16_49_10]
MDKVKLRQSTAALGFLPIFATEALGNQLGTPLISKMQYYVGNAEYVLVPTILGQWLFGENAYKYVVPLVTAYITLGEIFPIIPGNTMDIRDIPVTLLAGALSYLAFKK